MMSKIMQVLLFVGLFVFSATAQAGITVAVSVTGNSIGQDVYIVSLTSDIGPVTSLRINVESANGDLGQVHPAGFATPRMDFNPFIYPPAAVDQDTQAMFATTSDALIIYGEIDSVYMLDVNFTGVSPLPGFAPFESREVLQVVLQPGGEGFATLGVVVGGVEYTLYPEATYGPNGSVLNFPEPGCLGVLVVGGLGLVRRR